MTIQLTKKQQEAVEICLKRYKDKAPQLWRAMREQGSLLLLNLL